MIQNPRRVHNSSDRSLDLQIKELIDRLIEVIVSDATKQLGDDDLTALSALAGTGILARTAANTYALRTITGTAGEVDVSNGNGVAGNPTVTLPTVINGGHKFGTADNNTEVEASGSIKYNGTAQFWDDIQFRISSGRVSAANFPDWVTFTPNTSEYAFDVNDYIDLGAEEIPHWCKEEVTGHPHLHITTKGANSSGANRFAKFSVVLSYAKTDTVWTETTVGGELTIPDGTSALFATKLSLDTCDFGGIAINTQIKARVKRIAATGGTEYADHIFITQLGVHAEKDRPGSREITTK